MARLIAEYVAPVLGPRGVVGNRAGANGLIGAEIVVCSAPHGLTVLQCPMGTMTITPNLPGVSVPVDLRPLSAFVPGVQMACWFGICEPKGMSGDSLARWSDATRRALENATFRERLVANGLTPRFEDTPTFNARMAEDLRS